MTTPTSFTSPAQGGTWVLLRGLMREHGHWGSFPQRLQGSLGTERVLTPDLPGNGLLNAQASPTRIADMVDACRQQVRAELGTGHPPVHVLSISMGGMLAAAWAHSHPHELASLCLMSSSMRPFSPLWQRLRPANWPQILRLLVSQADDTQWETTILAMTTRSPQAAAALPGWLAIRRDRPVRTSDALRQLWAAARFRAPTTVPAMPTLILSGQQDTLVDPRCSQAISEAWGCPWASHPDAGHDLPLDAPDWVIQQLMRWQQQW